ncbi:MAG TPA: class I SAM-dependent DNA methyltransferase, partial [Paracoccus sp. (in: a-proteobacteria)]|nr:class I SAM-dependent DNA methyltransferase [Paracoccus sp. (in: a-proteobacteria)]
RAGLVATNSIRGGANRAVLRPIVEGGRIFEAWSDEEWTVDGAAVRVSMVCFDAKQDGPARLDGAEVAEVFADLSGARGGSDLTTASRLTETAGVAFQGPVKVGPFDVEGELAREWLALPTNPNGRKNGEVVRPLLNGMDITRRPSGRWIIDFGTLSEADANLFEAPFEYVRQHVKPLRDANRDSQRKQFWWRLGRSGSDMREAVSPLRRAIFTPRVAKHRLFVWAANTTVPDSAVVVIARGDDTTFGILHSRFHELWALRMGTFLGVGNDPRYTPSTTFETFPSPEELTPDIPAADYAADPRAQAIAAAAARLNELRENWLNPPDLVRRVPEVVSGYPDRLLPRDAAAERELKKRTLTNLYNARPAWLAHAHADLDAAVAEAYGWGDDWRAGRLTDDEILARLFALNQTRAAGQKPDNT